MHTLPPRLLEELKARGIASADVAQVTFLAEVIQGGNTIDAQQRAALGLPLQGWEVERTIVGHDVTVVLHNGSSHAFHVPA